MKNITNMFGYIVSDYVPNFLIENCMSAIWPEDLRRFILKIVRIPLFLEWTEKELFIVQGNCGMYRVQNLITSFLCRPIRGEHLLVKILNCALQFF